MLYSKQGRLGSTKEREERVKQKRYGQSKREHVILKEYEQPKR